VRLVFYLKVLKQLPPAAHSQLSPPLPRPEHAVDGRDVLLVLDGLADRPEVNERAVVSNGVGFKLLPTGHEPHAVDDDVDQNAKGYDINQIPHACDVCVVKMQSAAAQTLARAVLDHEVEIEA
jgi:hypothetical protein